MRRAWIVAALLTLPSVPSAQESGLLRVEIVLPGAEGQLVPIARYVLLISDNPATAEPRRVRTGADGTVEVRVRPGSYTVESDRPLRWQAAAYQWTRIVDVPAAGAITVRLDAGNAELVPAPTEAARPDAAPASSSPSLLLATWQESLAAVWSPTARATGFLVDANGLIATDALAIGTAATVEVQLSESLKVPGRVLQTLPGSAAAIVRVHPDAVAGHTPVPLTCPPARATALDDGDEVMALVFSLRRGKDSTTGEVTTLSPRGVDTDLRLAFGDAGGPVFDGSGALVGLTTSSARSGAGRSDAMVVRATTLCDAVSAARGRLSDSAPPDATHLPVDPTRPYPADTLTSSEPAPSAPATPVLAASDDFDVAFITPPMVQDSLRRAGRTGGGSVRPPDVEARLGQLTDFGAWSDYFAGDPPVVVVRVTPRLVEGFWKRLAREAARTQGAALPPLKAFKDGFLRLRATCGGAEVMPIHPFVLEHRVPPGDTNVVREGLYVFDSTAFNPACGSVALTLYSEKGSDKGESMTLSRETVDRIWRDFEAYRASGL